MTRGMMPSFCDGIFAEAESRTTGMEGGCRMLVGIDAEYIVKGERIVRSSYDLSENMMG